MSVYKEVPDWWYLTIFGSLAQLSAHYQRDAPDRIVIFLSLHIRVRWYFS
jgi:hypothetical protein